jgi:hypothetical protein
MTINIGANKMASNVDSVNEALDLSLEQARQIVRETYKRRRILEKKIIELNAQLFYAQKEYNEIVLFCTDNCTSIDHLFPSS